MMTSSKQAIVCFAMTLLSGAAAVVTAQEPHRFDCPPASSSGEPVLLIIPTHDVVAAASSSTGGISTAITSQSGDLCTLTLQDISSDSDPVLHVPIARSYDGRDWEATAGPLSDTLPSSLSCSEDKVCTFVGLSAPKLDTQSYVLTSYYHTGFGQEAEAARFLEQATFGSTRSTINDLVTSSLSQEEKYKMWVRNQVENVPMSSHREMYRLNANARYEYPVPVVTPGPETACHRSSHWRKFALSERDGLKSNQTKSSKYLSIRKKNGRYVWFIEGKAVTTTSYLPDFVKQKGEFMEKMKLEPTIYMILFSNNERFSCVGCLVPIQKRIDDTKTGGYVKNPPIDLTGILGTNLLPYTTVDLPPILGAGGATADMVSIDDGAEFASSPYFSQFNKPNDEFWLNNADAVKQSQCSNHPPVISAAITVKSELNYHGVIHPNKHPATVFPPIFGRTLNKQSGKYEHLLFDPHMILQENTVENPLPDGGGHNLYHSKGHNYCSNAPRTFENEDHCKISFSEYACSKQHYWNGKDEPPMPNPEKKGVVVCGSTGEIANDFKLGTTNGFDMQSGACNKKGLCVDIYNRREVITKHTIWGNHALYDEGQLRQRVAWALYQIIPIGLPMTKTPSTESWLQYYDIFVRHAFGSYFDILKKIAYTDVMSGWLTYQGNKSLQQNIDQFDTATHPDENFAREIMQLFSIGIFQLNRDGSKKVDEDGEPLSSYDSSDVMNMAKVWTGFTRGTTFPRGNAESAGRGPYVDPLVIDRTWKDAFPKADLLGGYIGDRYPLCADLPPNHHLKKGAIYRVIGSKLNAELQHDYWKWERYDLLRLKLESSSPLYPKLCAVNGNGKCTFPGKVILDEHLDYSSSSAQNGEEFLVDTIRTILVGDGTNTITYEYVRQPCVDKAFLGSDAKKLLRGQIHGGEVAEMMCADPKNQIASEECCESGSASVSRYCFYHGERMSFTSAIDRCAAHGKEQCNPKNTAQDMLCNYDGWHWAHWTTDSCMTRVKISYESGLIGRVDYPNPDYAGKRNVAANLDDTTKNFFPVAWLSKPELPKDSNSCNDISSCYSTDDGCVCDTSLAESAVYSTAEDIASKDDLLSKLHVGAFDPVFFDNGDVISLGNCGIDDGIQVYSLAPPGEESCSKFGPDTFFSVVNENSTLQYLKNLKSIVTIDGISSASFRNVVHFISLIDPDLRDMYYETDAVIEHFFHHPSHAPFLSIRMMQRFGISNPSPGFIERVATAYINGSHSDIGSGEYGDLSAMIAAILLDEESRSTTLDADPSHGHLREPLIKVTSLLRSMDAKITAPYSWAKLYQLGIGQDSYGSPSVFSFFLPEYQPPGVIEKSGLVAPESQILTGKQVTTLLDGLFSTIKFGLVGCFNGFGETVNFGGCPNQEGDFSSAAGTFEYSIPKNTPVNEAVGNLALMLTSGRLGETNRGIIEEAIRNEYYQGDHDKAIRIAQQLILSSPEFHSWGSISRNTGVTRVVKGYEHPPQHSYKNVVFFMMTGGVDSWNLVAPKGNCHGKDLYAEYRRARQQIALSKDDLLDIDATGSGQTCNTWGVNKHFPILQELYEQNEATFFLNMGILSQPLTKHDNWQKKSRVPLFAHNHMSRNQFELDPRKIKPGTGVGGRMLDMLRKNGYQTSGNTLGGNSKLNIGDSYYNNPVSTVTDGDISLIDEISSLGSDQMLNLVKQLNGVGKSGNSMLGETWSQSIAKTLSEYETSLETNEAIKRGDFNMDGYPGNGGLNKRFRNIAQYMKSRHMRNVDREVYFLSQGNYDFHGEDSLMHSLFREANTGLSNFINELKRQDTWKDTVILMGSDFGRSVEPNSNGGTDHAWGGHYFMLGGGIDGGKLMGEYPEDLSDKSDYWVRRGRMIPTTPWDAVWNGVAQWMGVQGDDDLEFILPSRPHFNKCTDLFSKHQLFRDYAQSPCIDDADGDGVPDNDDQCPNTSYWVDADVDDFGCQAPTTSPPTKPPISSPIATPVTKEPTPSTSASPTRAPTTGDSFVKTYEAEDPSNTLGDSAVSSSSTEHTGSGYVNMGGKDSWIQWPAIDGGAGGPCILNFRYAVKGTKSPRTCEVEINGNVVGSVDFTTTGNSWSSYGHAILSTTCPPGANNAIRLTATTEFGGPNLDNLSVSTSTVPATSSPIASPTDNPTSSPTEAPVTTEPTANPTSSPITSPTDNPTSSPTEAPVTTEPTANPTSSPITSPTDNPTSSPTEAPVTTEPTASLTASPTEAPVTTEPTANPTSSPTEAPVTTEPTASLTTSPTKAPAGGGASREVHSVIAGASIKVLGKDACSGAVDGTTTMCSIFRAQFADKTLAGFIATPESSKTIVKKLRVYSNDDIRNFDPKEYKIEGRNSVIEGWQLISSGTIIVSRRRNKHAGLPITSTFEAGDGSRNYSEVKFEENDTEYMEYQITFPKIVRNSSRDVAFAEVELPGYIFE